MPNFARVDHGIVVETFDVRPEFHPDLMAAIVPCASNAVAGWVWNGQTCSPAPGPTLAEMKAARRVEVSALYAQKLAAGMPYQGKTLQVDEGSQLRIVGAAAAAGIAGTVPSVGWRMADNTFLALPNAPAMIALGQAAAAYVEGLRARMWAHKDAIAALPDPGAVVAYDITAGW